MMADGVAPTKKSALFNSVILPKYKSIPDSHVFLSPVLRDEAGREEQQGEHGEPGGGWQDPLPLQPLRPGQPH